MQNILWVGCGGFLGAVLRYVIGLCFIMPAGSFPYATLTVNLLGCFVIGFLFGMIHQQGAWASPVFLFVVTGSLGGFTTFSTFGIETILLWQQGLYQQTLLYVTTSVLGGLIAVVLAWQLAVRLLPTQIS